jgi:hypothetical protein
MLFVLFLFHHYGLVKLKVGHKNLFREIRWSVLSCWVADWTMLCPKNQLDSIHANCFLSSSLIPRVATSKENKILLAA